MANHTTPIDIVMLAVDNSFTLVGLENSLLVQLVLNYTCIMYMFDDHYHTICRSLPFHLTTLTRLASGMAASQGSFRVPAIWPRNTYGLRGKWQKIEKWLQKGALILLNAL